MKKLNLFYYKTKNNLIISFEKENIFGELITEKEASNNTNLSIYFLINTENKINRRTFIVNTVSDLFIKRDSLNLLKKDTSKDSLIPSWLLNLIKKDKIIALNKSYPSWKKVLEDKIITKNKKWNINIVGLGDVGGTLITGLRLLGNDSIDKIGIYDKNINKIKRFEYECNQICYPSLDTPTPKICEINEDNLFDCDMFVFCVSVGVPKIGNEKEDVRLVQFKGNSKIVSYYAKLARERNFNGLFCIVSDPVDLLCKVAFTESNKDSSEKLDYKGLAPEQIRGYGLGVMNARASYYALKDEKTKNYIKEGRAFGPHGEGLIIANSIKNYNKDLSDYLTDKTKTANLEIRDLGFKPYIAPALSSGTLSILATIKSQWHYSTTFLNGTFMGIRNKFIKGTTKLENYENMPEDLFEKLEKTFDYLKSY
ncbi:lactate dehydrogenase [Clostridium oceanicum]|uniref:Lactate dehydrogenase n=1 Tax=Clostridium oceanicum TaxID=1543 RepID=A0ABN1JSU2_9CLOT